MTGDSGRDAGTDGTAVGDTGRVEEVVFAYVDNTRQRLVLASLLAVLGVVLVLLSWWVLNLTRPSTGPAKSSARGGLEWVRSIYGWGKGADQQLVAPTDVSIGPDGTIWCLSEHHKIVGFAPDGQVRKVIVPRIGASLEGISVDESGDLFVADYGGQIIRFKPDGSVAATWAVQLPSEVDVRDGKIAVAAAHGVAVFTPDDEILLKTGSRGQGKDQFDLPHGILQAGDRLYVADTQNRRVKAFTSAGRPLWTLGEAPDRTKPGAGDIRSADASAAPFELPTGMTIDGNGRPVLVDAFKFQVIALDPKTGAIARDSSKHKAAYGDQGNADGLFMYPTGIAYDKSRDWFAVADTGNNRIQIIRIPNSGGSVAARLASVYSPPLLVFLVPFALLAGPPLIGLVRWRRNLRLRASAAAG